MGNGGCLDLSCPLFDYCEYYIDSNTFINNTAHISGGAIKWDDVLPYNLTTNIFDQNSAVYGTDIASYPIKLEMIDNESLNS